MLMFRTALLAFSLVSITISAQGQTTSGWPKSLLWRISGKGLSANSFLYGTMHVQDQRLFHFTDSLYRYLEQTEGYALEVNFRELMDSIVQEAIDRKQNEMINEMRHGKWNKKAVIDSL